MTADAVAQSTRPWLGRFIVPLLGPLAIAAAYYISAEVAFLIGTLSDRIFAPFWPPNVVLFCALLFTPRKRWWVILMATFPAHVIAELGVDMPILPLVVAFATNCIVAILDAVIVRRLLGGPPWFGNIRNAIAYIITTAGVSPAIAAIGGAFVPILGGGKVAEYWIYASNWYVGNALAALTLGPIILTWMERDWRRLMLVPRWRQVEAVLFIVALFVTSIVSLRLSSGAFVPAILYLPLPVILWGSVRFGERGASGAILVLTVVSIWLTLNGVSPFTDNTPERSVLALQFYLISIAVPVILLTASIDQLRDADRTTRALTGSLMKAQDEERRRIARDLHDSTGQDLVAASLLVSGFRALLPDSALDRLRKCEELVQRAIREVGIVSYVLHPPALDELGLRLALAAYIDGFTERCGIKVDLHMPGDIPRLPSDTELALYRVVQEALTNVFRHSASATAEVRLGIQYLKLRNHLTLSIEDHGKGIQTAHYKNSGLGAYPKKGVGLHGMRERIRQIGGRLDVESVPGKTVVTAIVPLGDHV